MKRGRLIVPDRVHDITCIGMVFASPGNGPARAQRAGANGQL